MKKRKTAPFRREKKRPIYSQVAEVVRQRVQSGEFKEGDRLPSTKDLSQVLDVHYMTARQALKKLEAEGLISMHMGRGTFVNSQADKVIEIAVVVPDLSEEMPGAISAGMRGVFRGRPISLTFFEHRADAEVEGQCIERLSLDRFAGAVFFPSLNVQTFAPMRDLIISGYPIVFIDRAVEGIPCWLIASDHFAMGKAAADHLAASGVRRPACLSTSTSTVRRRLEGFRVGLNNHGIALPESRVLTLSTGEASTEKMSVQLLNADPPPDAIFYYNDYGALVGLKALHKLGVSVPDEIKIIGCDNIQAAHLANPSLTSVHQNFAEVGARSLELLLESIAAPLAERLRPRHEFIDVTLVARESTQRSS